MMVPSAYSYSRFSTPEQLKGDSLRRQHSKAEAYAAAHGLRLDGRLTFEDLGVSGFRGRNSETGRLADFLAAVEEGVVPRGSYLLVENLDRISRQAARKALRVLEDILERDIVVVTLDDGRAYTEKILDEDPTALLMALLTLIRANEESVRKSERLKAAWVGKRLKVHERILTSRAPAWLKANGTFHVIEDRAAIVRRIFDDVLDGTGLESIAKKLNDEQVRVFGGAKFWHRSYICKIVDNPAVIGTLVPHVVEYLKDAVTGRQKRTRRALEPIPNYYPAVVDLDVYRRVRAMRGRRMPSTRGSGIRSLLAGLVTCATCGGSMTRVMKGKRSKPYLVCSRAKMGAGCKYTAVPQDLVETTLRASLHQMVPLESEERIHALTYIEVHGRELLEVQHRIEGLVSAVAETQSSSLVVELKRLEQRQVELKQQIAELQEQAAPQLALGRIKLSHAAGLGTTELNLLLRQLFKRVEIQFENGEGAMCPVWKDGRSSMIFLNC